MSDEKDSKSDPQFMTKLYSRLWYEHEVFCSIGAYDLAKRAHAGQTRKNGEPYINHIERVSSQSGDLTIETVACLHDVLEDCKDPSILKELNTFPEYIVTAVKLLTRAPGETYFDFIHRILASGNQTAIAVKIADLKDNLRDLEEGHKKDKYRFALEMLEHSIRVRQPAATELH